jgi:hypothetical protein
MSVTRSLVVMASPYSFYLAEVAYNTWGDIKKYLDSPSSASSSTPPTTELVVVNTEVTGANPPLTAYDYLLIGTTATGALLMLATPAKWVGGAVLLASLVNGYQRGTTRVIGAAGALVAYAIHQPAEALKLAGAAAGAAFTVGKEAFQLSNTVVGALVTASGAIVGYLVLAYSGGKPPRTPQIERKQKRKKRYGDESP